MHFKGSKDHSPPEAAGAKDQPPPEAVVEDGGYMHRSQTATGDGEFMAVGFREAGVFTIVLGRTWEGSPWR